MDKQNDFGFAIRALKKGKKVFREGWNRKEMYLLLKVGSVSWNQYDLNAFPECRKKETKIEDVDEIVEFLPTICMKTADNKVLEGWLASQTDMLSEDWYIYSEN